MNTLVKQIKLIDGNKIMFTIGLAAMLFLLQYNWRHTGALLARYIQPIEQGYIAAAGIEIAVIWLSWRIGKLRKLEINIFKSVPGITLIAVMLISMLANIAEGFYTKYHSELTTINIIKVDGAQVIFGLFSTAIISIIVFSLSEVLSGDSKKFTPKSDSKIESKVVTKPEITIKSEPKTPVIVQTIDKPVANVVKVKQKRAQSNDPRREVFIEYITKNPTASYREIIRDTQVVNNAGQIKPLAEKFGYHKNGNGWTQNNES